MLLVSALLLIAWSFAIPIAEAPDELHHWQYARYLHEKWRLPIYSPEFVEANSPPLYYALLAPIAAYSQLPPFLAWVDGRGQLTGPFSPRIFQNSNSDFANYWPIRFARLATVAMSVLTVLFCWTAGKEATNSLWSGFLTSGLTAFLPQFTFRGMNVSNDALVTTFSAAALWLIILLLRRGFNWKLGLAAACIISGAFLSKTTAVFLPFPLVLVILSDQVSWSTRLKRAGGVLCIALFIVLPWLIRQQVLYGDPFAKQAMLTAVANIVETKPITSPYFTTIFPQVLVRSFIGVFGLMNLYLPGWIYRFFELVGVLGVLGYVRCLIGRRIDVRFTMILLSIPICALLVVIYINLSFSQPQGRYMFVALPAIALLIARGLEGLPGWSRSITLAAVGVMAVLNIYILSTLVIPAYWPPVIAQVSDAEIDPVPVKIVGQGESFANGLRIESANSRIVIDGNLDTSQFNFLQFQIEGTFSDPDIVGQVYFAGSNGSVMMEQSVPFPWLADGTRRQITIPLFAFPAWHGRLATFYIDPLGNAGVEERIGMPLDISHIKLRGRLDRPDTDLNASW
jgi:4-amino-4-deoxy-L-arabinose transferase-like glycosyltransferase